MSENEKWHQFVDAQLNQNQQQDTDNINDMELNKVNSNVFQQAENSKQSDLSDDKSNEKEQSKPNLTPNQQCSSRPNLDVAKILKVKHRLSY